jgi:hypothetical protein
MFANKSIVAARRAMLLAATSAVISTSAVGQSPTPSVPTVPLHDADCEFETTSPPNAVPPCTVDGVRTVTYNGRTRTVRNATSDFLTDRYSVAFSGNLKVDGQPLITGSPYLFPYGNENGSGFGPVDASYFFGTTGQTVNVTTSYNGERIQIVPTGGAGGSVPATPPAYWTRVSNLTGTVNSIAIDLDSYFETGDGGEYDYTLASVNPANVVNNATALAGRFHGTAGSGALQFGTLAGTATVSEGYAVTPYPEEAGAANTGLQSLYRLGYDIAATVTTSLDETGLIAPKVSVSQGIEMNGSRITGLGAATLDSDAVNKAQLDAAIASIGATGTVGSPYLVTNSNGAAASATGADAIALGSGASASRAEAAAIGSGAEASGDQSVALGARAAAEGFKATAVGAQAAAEGDYAIAIGQAARGSASRSTALGLQSEATGQDSFALGFSANGQATGATAIGAQSDATGEYATAIGYAGQAYGEKSAALGYLAFARGNHSLAIGTNAEANGLGAMAFGTQALASFQNAIALGYASQATRANQVMLGTSSYTYTLPGLPQAGSNAVQSGNLFQVTVDAHGNLGFLSTPISGVSGPAAAAAGAGTASVGAPTTATMTTTALTPVRAMVLGDDLAVTEAPSEDEARQERRIASARAASSAGGGTPPALSAVTDGQFADLSGRVSVLESRINGFDLRLQGVEGGVAAAMAMGQAKLVPDANISMTVAAATYGGQQGYAGSFSGRISDKMYISGSVSGNTGDKRVGGAVSATVGF